MFMIMLVLDDPDKLDDVLDAWTDLGVSGVTITESTGYYRRRTARMLGARYLFGAVTSEQADRGQYTLYTIVPDETTVRACLTAVEAITGDLSGPNTGVLAAWELDVVKGVPDILKKADEE